MKVSRVLSLTLGIVALFAVAMGCATAQAQPDLVQVPFVTTVWGVPGTPYSGTTAGSNCASSTPGVLNAKDGNGCPATQEVLQYIYGVATDASGNLVETQVSGNGIQVLYRGGATMANLITAALPSYAPFTPMVGHAYILTEGSASLLTLQSDGSYHCANAVANPVAWDEYGSGCPAQQIGVDTRIVTVDPDGNIFFGTSVPQNNIYVIYAGGVRAANLINAYFPAVAAAGGPKVGYVYDLSSGTTGSTDFITLGGIAVQVVSATQENVFVADRGTSASETGLQASTSGNQIKEFVCPVGTTGCNTAVNGTTYPSVGWATYIKGTTTKATNGDGGAVASASVDTPYILYCDPQGDLFIGDDGDGRVRVVYNGGTKLPLYNNNVLVTNPVIGDIYTAAGGGSGTKSPAAANTLASTPTGFGVDANGNLYFPGSSILWMESAQTGEAVAIGWIGATTPTYSPNSNPQAGATCNGLSSGPTMTDDYADGCPATEVTTFNRGASLFAFDPQGNFYIPEERTTSVADSVVREYSYQTQFGSTAVGASSSQYLAFTPSTSGGTVTYSPTLPPAYASAEFSDAGNDVCTTETGIAATQTCVVNVAFKPALAGARMGSVSLSQASTALATALLRGTGTGAQIALDPATRTSIGSGLQPTGVAIDASGNVYISSGTNSGSVYKSTAGSAPASFATGFDGPVQLALDGAENLYVADSGNNRIAIVSSAGGAASTFLGGSFTVLNNSTLPASVLISQSLKNPSGVAVDGYGDVFIADTGNSRILEVSASLNGGANSVELLGFNGLNAPMGLAVDANGDVFVADSGNHRIVELSAAGVQTTVSSAYSPSLSNPVGVAIDAADNLYVADAGEQQVYLLPAGGSTAISLFSNSLSLTGVAADGSGDLYVADSLAGYVTELNRTSTAYGFTGNLAVTQPSSPVLFTVTNSGSATSSLTLGSPLVNQSDPRPDFLVDSSAGEGCTSNGNLAPGQQCMLSVTFEPQSINPVTSTVTFASSNAVNPASIILSGQADQLGLTYSLLGAGTTPGTINTQIVATLSTNTTSTWSGSVTFVVDGGTPTPASVSNGTAAITIPLNAGSHTVTARYNGSDSASLTFTVVTGISNIALGYTPSSPTFGQPVVLTATTTTSNGQQTPTGTVTFTVNGIAQAPVAYAPTETLTLNGLPVGVTSVSASYSGDANYAPASTKTIPITIALAPTTTALQVTPNVAAAGDTITLTATVSPQFSVPPGGSVTFTYAGTTTSAIPLVNGSASFTTATSQFSSYTFTATYSGDNNYSGSTSTVTPKAMFTETLSAASLTVSQNAVGILTVQMDPFFGYGGGNIQISCGGLPSSTVCSTVPINGTALSATGSQSIQLQIATDVTPQAVQSARLSRPQGGRPLLVSGTLSFALLLLLPGWKQRRRFTQLLVVLCGLGCAVAISACGSDTANHSLYLTPTGIFNVTVSATDGTTTVTQPLSLTVIPGTTAARPTVRVAQSK